MGSRPENLYDLQVARSKIDYGCVVYNCLSCGDLPNLESVANEAMIIDSGCFKSTQTPSFQVITEEPPLQVRRDELNLKYYYKAKSIL